MIENREEKHSERCKKRWRDMGFDSDLYCLGVLFNCGHTFSCMYSEEAISHNHNKEANIEALCWTILWMALLIGIVFHRPL